MLTVAAEIMRRARETPQARAVDGTVAYTYADLAERVNNLAAELERATPPGSLVASQVASGHAGLVAMLAAGVARRPLLPLDLAYPPAYRASIVADARAALLVSEDESGEIVTAPAELPGGAPARTGLDDAAYVIYTSGSTGKPKGVVVSQEAFIARMAGFAVTPGMAPGESMLAMSALSFDISLIEMLLPLFVGGRTVVAPAETRRDPRLLAGFLDEFGPDVLEGTPSYWRLALASGWSGAPKSRIWSGGEALTASLARQLLPVCRELWNLYGPTEATICTTASRVRSPEHIVLGDTLPGTAAALDGGSEGEILIYGAGLAEGYLDRDELTRERFAELPTPHGPRRCYRTGDRGRLGPDGALEFLGRMDDQVKIRGNRIELGQIEAVLETHPAVHEVAALVLETDDPAFARLAAVVVADGELTARQLRAWAMQRLPRAMVPDKIVLTSGLPRTPAGKADRVAIRVSLAAQGAG